MRWFFFAIGIKRFKQKKREREGRYYVTNTRKILEERGRAFDFDWNILFLFLFLNISPLFFIFVRKPVMTVCHVVFFSSLVRFLVKNTKVSYNFWLWPIRDIHLREYTEESTEGSKIERVEEIFTKVLFKGESICHRSIVSTITTFHRYLPIIITTLTLQATDFCIISFIFSSDHCNDALLTCEYRSTLSTYWNRVLHTLTLAMM